MKKILIISILILTLKSFSQDFTYKIKIQNISNLSEAKMITDHLRNLFKCYPTFNDSLDTFIFTSRENISQSTLNITLSQNGYIIQKYDRFIRQEIIIKEEEK